MEEVLERVKARAAEARALLERERARAQQRTALVTMLRAYTGCLMLMQERAAYAEMHMQIGAAILCRAGSQGRGMAREE